MTDESAADRQAAQQAREQEKKWGDSAAAVSPDTQRADPDRGAGGASFGGDANRGESTVFDESDRTPDGPAEADADDDADDDE